MAGPETPPRGTRLGRYVVLTRLDDHLVTAFDEELDRKVVLRLLRPNPAVDPTGEPSDRQLEECRLLAKLSHPSVAAVHDVRLGGEENGGYRIVAMEHVEGLPAATWLEAAPVRWRRAVPALEQAGRGLAAAHEIGLVHGGFRPDCLVLGPDGQARVRSFRCLEDGAGDPTYQAPEQRRGEAPTPATDQYAFCAVLHHALAGAPPGGAPENALVAPGRIRRALLQGLAADPGERFGSMTDLLDALTRDPRKTYVRAAGLAAAVLVAGLAVYGFGQSRERRARLCQGAELKLAGIWDAGRKSAVRDAFLATGNASAEPIWRATERLIDRYTATWTAVHTEACEATWRRREQPEHVLDLRMQCLARRMEQVGALSSLLQRADASTVEGAVKAAGDLPELGRCSDVSVLTALIPLPDEAAVQQRWSELRGTLAEARALYGLGRFDEASRMLEEMREEVGLLEYPPLQAEWSLLNGLVLGRQAADFQRMEDAFFEAVYAARAGRHTWAEAKAWTSLIIPAIFLGQHETGLEYGRFARATIEGLGDDPDLLASWYNLHGSLLTKLFPRDPERLEEGMEHLRRSARVTERHHGPDHPVRGHALVNLAFALKDLGRFDEALPVFEQSLAVHIRLFGEDHPHLATPLQGLGDVCQELGRCGEAVRHYRRALVLNERSFGPDYPFLAFPLLGLGRCFADLGEACRAAEVLERAAGVWGSERDPGLRGEILFQWARARARAGEGPRSRQTALEALADVRAAGHRESALAADIEAWLATPGS